MSEQIHPWCSSPSRDEAIRAAEDAAAAERTPLPDHRDLPQAVAELRERVARLEAFTKKAGICEAEPAIDAVNPAADASVGEADGLRNVRDSRTATDGLRTERVTLEITMLKGGHKYHGDASSWDWKAILRHGQNFFGPGESVRVVEEADDQSDIVRAMLRTIRGILQVRDSHITSLTAERDAALRERDAVKGECERLGDRVVSAELACRRAEARVAELEAAAAPSANAGGESNQPWPMAFAVWGRGAVCGVSVSREDAGAMQREFAFDTEVMPLYAAPQPPRGWLTEEERGALKRAFDLLCDDDGDQPLAGTVQRLLARSTLPKVKVPFVEPALARLVYGRDSEWLAALAAAGVEVKVEGVAVDARSEAGGEVAE